MDTKVYDRKSGEVISLHPLTEKEKTLIEVLRSIWDNPGLLMVATQILSTDEQRQKLLDIIEAENLTTYDDTDEIIYIALDIADGLL